MGNRYHEIAFTPEVQALQAEHGSRRAYARRFIAGTQREALGPDERLFIEARDSFYLATVGPDDWPYIQHRGGPPGFLKVLDDHTLAFADLTGNKQYISMGNLRTNDRASLFLMDYPAQTRLKIFASVRTVEKSADAELAKRVAVPGYDPRVERVVIFDVEAFDWNCPQHITPRYTAEEINASIEPLRKRLAEAEAQLASAKAQGFTPG